MAPELIKRSLYLAFVISAFMLSMLFLFNGFTNSDWHDFDVFYYAAKAALNGESIYIIVGQYNLPFWYFPWTAWLFIPFAVWPHNIALILYQGASILCAILVVSYLVNYYNPTLQLLDRVLVLSLLVPMSLQVMIVGQMEYILLALIVLTMYTIDQRRTVLAGAIIPFLWTKPHLLIVFTLMAFWLGGKRTILTSLGATSFMLAFQSIIRPGWHLEMLALLSAGQQRSDGLEFTTFPSLLGFQENWVGTGNLPLTLMLILLSIGITWRFRSLPVIPLLSLALTASVVCAPRAYAYDLPLLIPTLIWLTAKDFKPNLWIWLLAGIFPILTGFRTETYLLVVFVFALGMLKAHREMRLLNDNPAKYGGSKTENEMI